MSFNRKTNGSKIPMRKKKRREGEKKARLGIKEEVKLECGPGSLWPLHKEIWNWNSPFEISHLLLERLPLYTDHI